MSHFSVMVCLPGETKDINEALEQALAPYDENIETEPRPDYEETGPDGHWFVEAIRRNAAHLRDGTGLKTYDPNGFFSYASDRSKKTHDEQRAEFAEWAALEAQLDDPLTWPTVARLHNEKYGYTERTEDGDLNRETLHIDEDGRAFTWTTYNPDSKWDYWRIGGRWSGYFIATEMAPELIQPDSHWDGPRPGTLGRLACDGGPRRLLDFEAMRERAGIEADDRYSRYEALVEQHGTAKPWSYFRGLAEVGTCTWDEARAAYGEQPLIFAHRNLPYEDQLTGMACLVEEFFLPRVEHVLAARTAAVPAYGTVTLKREWAAPGRMGWWGMSSDERGDREAYQVAINKYLDEVPEDTWLVVVDCHI
jgi:hypothetical protein